MLIFGHIGITAGVVKVCDILTPVNKRGNDGRSESSTDFSVASAQERLASPHLGDRVKKQISSIDYRLVLIGSLLPDIIDKPLWFLFNRLAGEASFSGRDYAHTLLFNLALLIGGLVLLRWRKSWLLILSLCSFGHLVLDQLWHSPAILLWPLLGPLAKEETAGWWSNIVQELFSQPQVYIPEIIGLIIILLFTYQAVVRKSIINFIRSGAIS